MRRSLKGGIVGSSPVDVGAVDAADWPISAGISKPRILSLCPTWGSSKCVAGVVVIISLMQRLSVRKNVP